MKRQVLIGFFLITQIAVYAQITWDGSTSSDWEVGSNWSGGSVPSDGDDIIIPNSSSYTNAPDITANSSFTPNDITVQSGGVLIISGGTLSNINNFGPFDSGDMTVNGTLNVTGGTLDINGDLNVDGGTLNLTSGEVEVGTNNSEYVYVTGGGTIDQSGGTLDTRDLYADDGTVDISGGTVTADDFYVYGTADLDVSGTTSVTTDDFWTYGEATTDFTGSSTLTSDNVIASGDGDFTFNGNTLFADVIESQGDSATLNLTGGTVTVDEYIGIFGTGTTNISTTVNGNQNGTFNGIYVYDGGTLNVEDGADINNFSEIGFEDSDTSVATININGGTLDVTGGTDIASSDNDVINIAGGDLTIPGTVDVGSSDVVINVSGGSLDAGTITDSSNSGGEVSDNITASGGGEVMEAGVTVLPVDLIAFDGSQENNHIYIKWTTASEINNDYFVLERSLDGKTFEALSTIDGNGTTDILHDYEYRDYAQNSGMIYYRLTQYDFDGGYEIFPTILVQSDFTSLEESMTIYPNPMVGPSLNITLSGTFAQQPSDIAIYDLRGNLLLDQSFEDSYQIVLNNLDAKLPTGVYFLKISNGQHTATERIIKK